MTQAEFLRAAQEVLSLTRLEFATRLEVNPRTLNNWFLPPESKEFRNMQDEHRVKIHEMLRAEKESRIGQKDWGIGCELLIAVSNNCDGIRLDWNFAEELAKDFREVAHHAIEIYAAPIAAWLADPHASPQIGESLRPAASRLEWTFAACPALFPTKKSLAEALKSLPPPANRRKRYSSINDLLEVFEAHLR